MKITICYTTSRMEPMFDWFFDSLISQYSDKNVTDKIIIIDSYAEIQSDRLDNIKEKVNDRFKYIHLPPKPSIWRGKYKKTKGTYFDLSGTRNTGMIVCDTEYIVYIDDLSVLMPNWLSYHKNAALHKNILAGSFDKVDNIKFENNKFISCDRKYMDQREFHQQTDEQINIGGGWLFGANAGYPLEYLIHVNGHDEFYARRGCEDCNLGIRLENAGFKNKIFYNKNCLVIEDEKLHYVNNNSTHIMRRWSLNDEKYKTQEKYDEKHKICSSMMNVLEKQSLHEKKEILPLNIYFNYTNERKLFLETMEFRSIENDTFIDFDGETLEDL